MNIRSLCTTIALAASAACLSAGPASGQRIGEPEQSSRQAPVVRLASLSPRDARVHEPLWSLVAPQALALDNARAPVVIWHGTAFFTTVHEAGAPDAPLQALDERTGRTRWTSAFPAQPMAASGGLVYAVSARGIVGFDVATGALRWTAPGTWMQMVDRVAIISTGDRLEARDAATGRLRWSARWIGYAQNAEPDIVPDGVNAVGATLLVHTVEHGATTTGFEYAYDLRDGRALWRIRLTLSSATSRTTRSHSTRPGLRLPLRAMLRCKSPSSRSRPAPFAKGTPTRPIPSFGRRKPSARPT